jgi:hypothetical protein
VLVLELELLSRVSHGGREWREGEEVFV